MLGVQWYLCRHDGSYVLQYGFAVRIFNQLNTNPVGIGTDQPFSLKLGVIENRTCRFDDTAAIVHDALRHFVDVARPYGQMSESQLVRSEERRVGKESRSRWSPYH